MAEDFADISVKSKSFVGKIYTVEKSVEIIRKRAIDKVLVTEKVTELKSFYVGRKLDKITYFMTDDIKHACIFNKSCKLRNVKIDGQIYNVTAI
jgi:hypothetical protein